MTVTAEQITAAKTTSMREVELIATCCDQTGVRFYIALAMLQKESWCRNLYGHDAGGALSGFPGTVNKDNYAVFRWLVFTKGQTSNGVGPSQITSKGLLTQMEQQGLKPWDLKDNIAFGITLIYGYYRHGRDQLDLSVDEALRYAGKRYNGAATYGDAYLEVAKWWKAKVGSADYA